MEEAGRAHKEGASILAAVPATEDPADEGGDMEIPDLARKLSGDQGPGGWGLFLIRRMVDGMEVTAEGERRTVRLTMRTPEPQSQAGGLRQIGGTVRWTSP